MASLDSSLKINKVSPFLKYQTNLFTSMVDLAVKARQISMDLDKVVKSVEEFNQAIEKANEQIPQNDLGTSFSSLLKKNMDVQMIVKTNLQLVSNSYKTFGQKLKGRWDWKEVVSETERLKKQQMKEIFNIHSYRNFNVLLGDMNKLFSLNIDENALENFMVTSESLKNERVEFLSIDYNKTLNEILRQEKRGNDKIPKSFEKMMYKLYYESDNIEGAFRQNGSVNEMSDYIERIGVVDVELMNHVLISAIIKKFLRETSEPIWPTDQYDQLIHITNKHSSNPNKWKEKFKALWENVPQQNQVFIEYLIALCLKIIDNPTSKMTIQNMSICLAPSFLRKGTGDIVAHSSHQIVFNAFMNMLQYAKEIFPHVDRCFRLCNYQSIVHPHTLYSEIFSDKVIKIQQPSNRLSNPASTPVSRHKRRALSYLPQKSASTLSFKDLC